MISKTHIFFLLYLILAFSAISCDRSFKDVQNIGYSEFVPSGKAENFDLKYTDSGKITSILVSPLMLDYATVSFPFTEFPDGMNITFFDKSGKKTFVKSDYAVTYKNTNLFDLQGNVNISTEDGQNLATSQLYYDQKNEWFFTEKKFKFTDPKGVSYGEGIDFSKDFKIINSQKISGEIDRTE